MSGARDVVMGLSRVTWERSLADRAAAERVRDSLSTALTRRGLREYACRNGGRRWLTPEVGVDYTIGAVFPDGLLRVAVFATTMPSAFPEFTCPAAPTMPLRAPARPPRRAAT